MITEEIKELEEMFKHGRFHLEEELAESPEDSEELRDLLGSFKRIETAIQDKKSHQLILDLFLAFSFLDQGSYDCDEDEEFDDEIDE